MRLAELKTNLFDDLKKYSYSFGDKKLLTNSHWLLFNPNDSLRLEIFLKRSGGLVQTANGISYKGSWEILGRTKLLLSLDNEGVLYELEYIDNFVLVLRRSGGSGVVVFLNEFNIPKLFTSIQEMYDFILKNSLRNV